MGAVGKGWVPVRERGHAHFTVSPPLFTPPPDPAQDDATFSDHSQLASDASDLT
jgi:hypothetical protein